MNVGRGPVLQPGGGGGNPIAGLAVLSVVGAVGYGIYAAVGAIAAAFAPDSASTTTPPAAVANAPSPAPATPLPVTTVAAIPAIPTSIEEYQAVFQRTPTDDELDALKSVYAHFSDATSFRTSLAGGSAKGDALAFITGAAERVMIIVGHNEDGVMRFPD